MRFLSIGTCLVVSSLITLSCTQSKTPTPQDPKSVSVPVKTIEVSNFQEGDVSVSADDVRLLPTDQVSRESSKILILTNSSDSQIPLNISLQPMDGFKIKVNRCGPILASHSQCWLEITFASRGIYEGMYSTGIEINSTMIAISVEVKDSKDPAISGTPVLEVAFKENKNFSFSDEIPYRDIVLKNTGTGLGKSLTMYERPNEYVIRLNRCPENISPNTSSL